MPLILITIGLVLIIYNYRAIKRENVIKQENNSNISFQSVLQDNKDELSDYKIEIGLLRRDIAESLTELQEEIVEIKNDFNKFKNNEIMYENKDDLEINYILNQNDIDSNKDTENNESMKEQNNKINKDFIDESTINDEVIYETTFLENGDSNKTQSIKKLLNEGLTEEQICYELSVSKGEVLLVKGLFKK